jgi:hypothetical protein
MFPSVRALRAVLLAMLFSLLFGAAIGTWLRLRMERPRSYLGLAPAAAPLHVVHAGTPVLEPRQREEQI